ncbi:MAG TPA: diguanylate cyclase [Candidatus Angelobacter sp.]|nr:diguanylate cyclase [Candidatus Angelobacter sp.]
MSAQSLPLPEHPRFTFQKIPEHLGLSTATVTSLAQDSQGFLWIGTQDGLFRYDGANVIKFAAGQGLGDFRIDQLFISPRGDLWAVSLLGVWRYVQGRFKQLPLPDGHKLRGLVMGATVDKDNVAWVVVDDGILLEINADHPEDFHVFPAGPVRLVTYAPDDSILIGLESRVARIPKGSKELEVLPGDLPDLPVYALVTDGNGDIWARTPRHFSRWDSEKKGWIQDDAGLPGASEFGYPTVTRLGDILLPTIQGLYRRSHGRWEAIGEREGMGTNALFAAIEDFDGAIWLGFGGNGVERWPGPNEWLGWSRPEGLPDSVVWSTVRDSQKRLWVATNTGLGMWSPSQHQWRIWNTNNGLSGEVRKLVITPQGALWGLSVPGGLFWIDLQTLDLHTIRTPEHAKLLSKPYGSIAPGPGGCLLAGGSGFIDQYKNVKGQIIRSSISVPDTVKMAVRELQVMEDGVIWGAGRKGVSRFDGKQWQFISPQDGLLNESVSTIGAASSSELWVSYFEPVGVTRIRVNKDGRPELRHYTTADGLASNSIYLIARDHNGNVWLGGDQGVTIIHPDGTFSDETHSSGLLWDDVSADGFYEDADGGIFIGTSRGLAYRRPNIPTTKSLGPETVITSVTFAGREMFYASHHRISYRDATFEAHFSVPAIDSPAGQSCKYQLQGLERDPVETTLRQVRYTALPAGDYTFAVSCGALNRGWSAPATWSFTIQPPWWQRLWSRIGLLILLIFAIAWITRVRTHALENQRRRLEAAVAARNAELWAANKQLEEASLKDPLTGIRNRRFFELTIPRDVQQTIRAYQMASPSDPPKDRDLVFFIVDIDHFKSLNDTWGHATGDEVLIAVARRLASVIRETDVLVRWGGEEFLIVSQSTSPAAARQVARRILDATGGQPFETSDGLSISKTCSVGWAVFPWISKVPVAVPVDDIIKLADRALYMAKQGGRNRAIGLYPDETMEDEPLGQQKDRPRAVEIHGPVPAVEHQS